MKSGFLNTKPTTDKGLLEDDRSRPIFGWEGSNSLSSGGWERYNEMSTGDNHSPPYPDSENTFSSVDCPLLPLSLGQPKLALSPWYGRRHKDFVFCVNDCFVTWGSPHEPYFTSVFTCPASQEKFMCGSLKSKPYKPQITLEKAKEGIQVEIKIVWYKKKKEAEHAAAARALDCLSYREGMGQLNMSYGLCEEDPYMKDEYQVHMPCSAPDEVSDEVMTRPVEIISKTEEVSMDEDTSQFRSDYRSIRQGDDMP
eukprot:scaffold10272_cov276-Chaetoceros_neogracile.AAC.6